MGRLMRISGHRLLRIRIMPMQTVMPTKVSPIHFSSYYMVLIAIVATDGGAIPFNTQFFHDDYDDPPGFDDVYDADDAPVPIGDDSVALEPGEQDLLAATQGQRRRIRPENVNYAKRAKRVDVRKLKENIWKGLDIVVPPIVEEGREETVRLYCFIFDAVVH